MKTGLIMKMGSPSEKLNPEEEGCSHVNRNLFANLTSQGTASVNRKIKFYLQSCSHLGKHES